MQARVGGEEWLAGLAPFLREAGIDIALAKETVDRLRAAGATEQQLRSTTTAEDLKAMGILLGPRCARDRAARRLRPCLLRATARDMGLKRTCAVSEDVAPGSCANRSLAACSLSFASDLKRSYPGAPPRPPPSDGMPVRDTRRLLRCAR